MFKENQDLNLEMQISKRNFTFRTSPDIRVGLLKQTREEGAPRSWPARETKQELNQE